MAQMPNQGKNHSQVRPSVNNSNSSSSSVASVSFSTLPLPQHGWQAKPKTIKNPKNLQTIEECLNGVAEQVTSFLYGKNQAGVDRMARDVTERMPALIGGLTAVAIFQSQENRFDANNADNESNTLVAHCGLVCQGGNLSDKKYGTTVRIFDLNPCVSMKENAINYAQEIKQTCKKMEINKVNCLVYGFSPLSKIKRFEYQQNNAFKCRDPRNYKNESFSYYSKLNQEVCLDFPDTLMSCLPGTTQFVYSMGAQMMGTIRGQNGKLYPTRPNSTYLPGDLEQMCGGTQLAERANAILHVKYDSASKIYNVCPKVYLKQKATVQTKKEFLCVYDFDAGRFRPYGIKSRAEFEYGVSRKNLREGAKLWKLLDGNENFLREMPDPYFEPDQMEWIENIDLEQIEQDYKMKQGNK